MVACSIVLALSQEYLKATMLRIALCQVNTTIGAFAKNVDKCLEFLRKAATQKAELAVFPELALSSYPPLDLLDREGFIEAHEKALEEFRSKLSSITGCPQTIVLGSILRNPSPEGRAIMNGSLVFHQGKLVLRQEKRLLPTYDVFDEARYFQAGEKTSFWDSPWGKLGIAVCEDAWFEDPHMGRKIYQNDPACALKGAKLVINTSASPFDINKRKRRRDMFAGFVKRTGAPVIFVNQVGGNDEILFDGVSAVYTQEGEAIFEMPAFREALAVMDFNIDGPKQNISREIGFELDEAGAWKPLPFDNSRKTGADHPDLQDAEVLRAALVTGIRDYFRKTGFTKAVLGLSGGIDSAVIACLAAEALGPRNVLGVSMPSQYSSSHSLADAAALAKAVGIEYFTVPVKFMMTPLLMELKPHFGGLPLDFTEENIQARLRAVIVMALSNKRRALTLTTGNKSELGVGYCTTYGDMAGALAPLGDVYKTRVYELARHINKRHGSPLWIPESTLTKPPSAELRPNQTDQDTLPPYDVLDRILELYFEGLHDVDEIVKAGFDRTVVDKVVDMIRNSEFKRRQAAPVLKVTNKAFGIGRRVPVAKAY